MAKPRTVTHEEIARVWPYTGTVSGDLMFPPASVEMVVHDPLSGWGYIAMLVAERALLTGETISRAYPFIPHDH